MARPLPHLRGGVYAVTPWVRLVVSAESQFVSLKTVETHLYNVYRKVGVKNRVGLVNALALYHAANAGNALSCKRLETPAAMERSRSQAL